MENPLSWNKATKVISKCINDHKKMVNDGCCGLSLPQFIYDTLVRENIIKEKSKQKGIKY